MSKKLIAVASAAALALSALVAMPTVANATPGSFLVTTEGAATNHVSRDGSTAAKAIQVNVPSADVLRLTAQNAAVDTIQTGSVIELTVRTPSATDVITVTTTGGVEAINATQFAATSPASTTATGVTSLSVTSTTGSTKIYVYTTSTAAGTAVVSAAGSSQTVHLVGLSNVVTNQYKLAFSTTATAAISGTIAVTGTVRDMFDNLLTPTDATLTTTTLGGSLSGAAVTESDFLVNATSKVVTFTVPSSTTASNVAVSVVAVTPANSVAAFTGRATSGFFTVSAIDLSAQITTLNAQITALTAQLAALTASTVTKAEYNKLVRKFNRTNPAKRVARVL